MSLAGTLGPRLSCGQAVSKAVTPRRLLHGTAMPTRVAKNVSITPELLKFVQAQIATGRYQNSSEVMRAALRALEREEITEQERRTRLSSGQVRS